MFIEFMTPVGASKGCHNQGAIISVQEVIKRPLKDTIPFVGIGIYFANIIDCFSLGLYLYSEPMPDHQVF